MTDFVKLRVTDLIGATLDWAVAKVEGVKYNPYYLSCGGYRAGADVWSNWFVSNFKPSTAWADGGPLIEKHRLSIVNEHQFGSLPTACVEIEVGDCWRMNGSYSGETPLIAACRAIVAAKLGETVSVPKELLPC